jgi:retinol dehydrogenase 12
MEQKIILITGSTSGIGEATVKNLVKTSSQLILPVRNLQKGENLKIELQRINLDCKVDLYKCDMDSIQSIKDFASEVLKNYSGIDVLINNAGIMKNDVTVTKDGIEETFVVNVLSQFLLNNILLPLLKNSNQGRIINVSSMGHNWGKPNFEESINATNSQKGGLNMYYNSNLFRNLLTIHQAKLLEGTNITVNCLHPGVIRSNLAMQNNNLYSKMLKFIQPLLKSSEEGAKTTIYLANSVEGGQITGKYWADSKVAKQSEISKNPELASKLWNYLEQRFL